MLKKYARAGRTGGLVFVLLSALVGSASASGQTLTTLISFSGGNGADPYYGSLIADANGNLFGTTYGGGGSGYGTVFEIVKSSGVYASTPTTLVSFDGGDGASPSAGLIADANGNLFGTTNGGGSGYGTVFEVTGSGFVPPKHFQGTPGSANCTGTSISMLAQTYGGIAYAAPALGYASVSALQSAVASYCGK
jgi:hypothetical protein